jgi:hypothetical protein
MTFFFAIGSTLIQTILLFIFEKGIAISWGWGVTDLLLFPLFDALYAFLWFTLPAYWFDLTGKKQVRVSRHFRIKGLNKNTQHE